MGKGRKRNRSPGEQVPKSPPLSEDKEGLQTTLPHTWGRRLRMGTLGLATRLPFLKVSPGERLQQNALLGLSAISAVSDYSFHFDAASLFRI
jgi:hypothetical protein